MKVLNFGSLNIDHVYQVPHFVQPGETLASTGYRRNAGGKGLNQSIAMARAGLAVSHAGKIGADGLFLRETLASAGVGVADVLVGETPTGHAIIQVTPDGQNDILLYPGANRAITRAEMDAALARQEEGTWLVLQNEVNDVPYLIEAAARRGMPVAINPAPCGPEVREYPLELVSLLFVNEIEGAQLSGLPVGAASREVADALGRRWPSLEIVLTLGKEGALHVQGEDRLFTPSVPVRAVDTTSAGDAFCGFFLGARLRGEDVASAMRLAARAAAITVSRPGAAESIPDLASVG